MFFLKVYEHRRLGTFNNLSIIAKLVEFLVQYTMGQLSYAEGVDIGAPSLENLVNITVFGGFCFTWATAVYTGQAEIWHRSVQFRDWIYLSVLPVLQ